MTNNTLGNAKQATDISHYGHGADIWRKPTINEGETELFSECGRVLNNIDYRSHWFVIVQEEYGSIVLRVKHGGGEESIEEHALRKVLGGLELLDSDTRYLIIYALYQMHYEGKRKAKEETKQIYNKAFVDGRLKKRKYPAQNCVKVWIEA